MTETGYSGWFVRRSCAFHDGDHLLTIRIPSQSRKLRPENLITPVTTESIPSKAIVTKTGARSKPDPSHHDLAAKT